MPNNISHVAKFYGEQEKIEKLFSRISTKETDEKGNEFVRHIDFNKIIPQPSDLYQGGVNDEISKQTKGHNWYDWNIANWGTKWNAYYSERNGNIITFDTAWNSPLPIMKKLHEICKEMDVTCEVTYADEDYGYNTGCYSLGGDDFDHTMHDDCSPEAWKAYRETHEGWEDWLILNEDGTMSHIEE